MHYILLLFCWIILLSTTHCEEIVGEVCYIDTEFDNWNFKNI